MQRLQALFKAMPGGRFDRDVEVYMREALLQGKLSAALHELRLFALGHIHLAGLHDGSMDETAQGHGVDAQRHLRRFTGHSQVIPSEGRTPLVILRAETGAQ